MLKVKPEKLIYTTPPEDGAAYTEKMDKMYSWAARPYDAFMAVFPLWKKWLRSVLPYVKNGKLLEVSFGPAWLMRQYPKDIELYGLDYNETMVARCKKKLGMYRIKADIIEGNVEDMPYPDNFFDTVVNTMAFSGYPNGALAMSEMLRVLKHGGTLLVLDYDFPPDRNLAGYLLVRFIEACGDIIKNISGIIESYGVSYEMKTVGGAKSIQLFIIKK